VKIDPSNVIVYPNGKLLHVPRAYIKTACDVNYQNWPWGDQNCTFIGGFIFASLSRKKLISIKNLYLFSSKITLT
jgi:hypothetical protein